jgi:rRNA biogenesis protein RRP5
MKIFGQISSVQPLALIVSLPNQLLAHVPITNVSPQLTSSLEAMELDDDPHEEDEDAASTSGPHTPDLFELFRPGEYVRAVVTAVHEPGLKSTVGLAKTRDPVWNASRRVELSLVPDKVNDGIQKTDLRKGFVRGGFPNHPI